MNEILFSMNKKMNGISSRVFQERNISSYVYYHMIFFVTFTRQFEILI